MIERIVEVAEDRRHLFLYRGFLIVQENGGQHRELGRIPIDDIGAVIANAHGISYTNNILVALADKGAPFVLCASNHNAVGMLWPIEGNFQQAKRMDAQIAASKPQLKQLWASVVKAKLAQQAAVLASLGLPCAPLTALLRKVRSGDAENIEAQGARRYWSLLFGNDFRRDRDANGLNSCLNYGYTVYRAAMARAVIAAGLHPSIGIHHSNEGNAMRLVDDLMEPFRPIVDWAIWQLALGNQDCEINSATKRHIVHTLYNDLISTTGRTLVMVCMQRLAISLAQVLMHERKGLDFHDPESIKTFNALVETD